MNNVTNAKLFGREDAIMTIAQKKPVPPIMPPSPYEEVISYGKIETQYREALRGKRKFKKEAVNYDMCRERNNVYLWRELKPNKTTGKIEYRPRPYHSTVITEPKERLLNIPKLRDKIVQLVIHQELQNLYRPVFVARSFACQYGKGSIRAAFNVQRDMRVAKWQYGDEAVVVKIDVRKFFYNIDRDILKTLLVKRFKALKKKQPELAGDFDLFLELLEVVIDSSPEGERGIPLGNVSSQDFANIYLNELDQCCIRFLGIKFYTRYMDDVIIVAPNMETGKEWLKKIIAFLDERLHLETNDKTKIFYLKQGVNAYGFKIKTTHLKLRAESKRRAKRRIKAMDAKRQDGRLTTKEVNQTVQSWLGFARWACAYNLCKKIFAPYKYIKVEGEMLFGSISRNRQVRRVLQ